MRRLRLVLLLLLLAPAGSSAQIASPGKLARAHSELEGLRSCTRCHELRQPGASAVKCLDCHGPLAERVARRAGYHGRLAERDCGACHREHIGVAGDILRLDTTAFRHEDTGWALRGSHARTECRTCHRPEHITDEVVRAYQQGRALRRTFLGVTRTCGGCHRADSPHEPEVNRRACDECHTEADWTDVTAFDHERTRYPLTGAHRAVACAACHESGAALKLRGLRFGACTDCHRDPHAGSFGAGCAQCHSTRGWAQVARAEVERRFDHARTGFALRGAHGPLDCGDCHDRSRARRAGISITFRAGDAGTYPVPQGAGCVRCHVDFHERALRGAAAACDRCHGEAGWLPVRFDVRAHERTRYPLVGAHQVVPCGECHARPRRDAPPRLRWRDLDCRACHADDDPHDGRFGTRACASCHADGTFAVSDFDHAGLGGGECQSCHRGDDPHGGQFPGRGCDGCHETASWRVARYAHPTYPLEGAHATVACAGCHPATAGVTRYTGVPKTCTGCHGGER